MHFVFIACQVEDYRNILKTSAIKKWAPGIKINKSNKSKIKNPANLLPKSILWQNPKTHDLYSLNGSKNSTWFLHSFSGF